MMYSVRRQPSRTYPRLTSLVRAILKSILTKNKPTRNPQLRLATSRGLADRQVLTFRDPYALPIIGNAYINLTQQGFAEVCLWTEERSYKLPYSGAILGGFPSLLSVCVVRL